MMMKSDLSEKTTRSVSVQVFDSDFVKLVPLIFKNHRHDYIKPMETRSKRFRKIAFACLIFAVSGIIGFGYFCPDKVGFFFDFFSNMFTNSFYFKILIRFEL